MSGARILQGLDEAIQVERTVTAAMVALAEANVAPDIQEMLYQTGAIHRAIAAALNSIAADQSKD